MLRVSVRWAGFDETGLASANDAGRWQLDDGVVEDFMNEPLQYSTEQPKGGAQSDGRGSAAAPRAPKTAEGGSNAARGGGGGAGEQVPSQWWEFSALVCKLHELGYFDAEGAEADGAVMAAGSAVGAVLRAEGGSHHAPFVDALGASERGALRGQGQGRQAPVGPRKQGGAPPWPLGGADAYSLSRDGLVAALGDRGVHKRAMLGFARDHPHLLLLASDATVGALANVTCLQRGLLGGKGAWSVGEASMDRKTNTAVTRCKAHLRLGPGGGKHAGERAKAAEQLDSLGALHAQDLARLLLELGSARARGDVPDGHTSLQAASQLARTFAAAGQPRGAVRVPAGALPKLEELATRAAKHRSQRRSVKAQRYGEAPVAGRGEFAGRGGGRGGGMGRGGRGAYGERMWERQEGGARPATGGTWQSGVEGNARPGVSHFNPSYGARPGSGGGGGGLDTRDWETRLARGGTYSPRREQRSDWDSWEEAGRGGRGRGRGGRGRGRGRGGRGGGRGRGFEDGGRGRGGPPQNDW